MRTGASKLALLFMATLLSTLCFGLVPAFAIGSGELSGKVTDSIGAPIEAVYIDVSPVDARGEYDFNSNNWYYAQTSPDGSYKISGIAPGNYKISFWPEEEGLIYSPEWFNDRKAWPEADIVTIASGQTSVADAAFEEGGSISGKVVGESADGTKPLPGVIVEAYSVSEAVESWLPSWGQAATDENGNYTISGLSTGTYKVKFNTTSFPPNAPSGKTGKYCPEYYNDKGSWESADTVVVTKRQDSPGIDAALEEGGKISGLVTGETAGGVRPLPDIWVFALPVDVSGEFDSNREWGHASTGSDGSYQLTGLTPGLYKIAFQPAMVELRPSEGDSGNYLSELYNNKSDRSEADIINIAKGQELSGIDAVMDSGGSISGRVTDAAGNGLAGISVGVYPASMTNLTEEYPPYMVITDDSGMYSFSGLLPGSYKVVAGLEQSGFAVQWYNNKPSYDMADIVTVEKFQVASDINFVIEPANDTGSKETSSTVNPPNDTMPPVVTIISPVSGGTNDNTPVVSFTVDDTESVAVVKVDGVAISKESGDSLDKLADGEHIITVQATDKAGNTGSAEVPFTVDATSPVTTTSDPADGATGVYKAKTVIIQFSEGIRQGDAFNDIRLECASGQIAAEKSMNGNAITIDPEHDLSYSTTYTVAIPADAVRGIAGNSLNAEHKFSFTTQAAPATGSQGGSNQNGSSQDEPTKPGLITTVLSTVFSLINKLLFGK